MNPLRWRTRAVLALALTLRLLPILATRAEDMVPDWPVALDRDGVGYAQYARNLVERGRYCDNAGDRSHRAPGYPLLVALGFLAGSDQFFVLRVLQAGIGTLAALALALLAGAAWGKPAGRRTLLLAAVYPPFLFYSPQVLNSTLYLALVAGTLAAMYWASEGDPGRAGVAGLLLGAAALTAGTALGATPALAGWLLWRRLRRKEGWGRSLGAVAIFTAGIAGMVAPWTAWNWKVHHAFILLDTNSGGVLFLGNVNYAYWRDDTRTDALETVRRTTDYEILGEADRDRLLRGITLRWMREHPADFLRAWMGKFVHLWSPLPDRKGLTLALASLGTYGVVLGLGAWGAWLAVRQRSHAGAMLIGWLLAVSVVHAFFVTAQRHRVPILDPALIVLGASALRRWGG